MLSERKKILLNNIIREHIVLAQPVGSGTIVEKFNLGVSPATIRNEMMALEKEGYIFQPHTSAGRLPTEKGWKFYLENFIKDKNVSKGNKQTLSQAINIKDQSSEQRLKNLAKSLAEISKETVIVGFSSEDIYYTGLSNLFRQPEFTKYDLIYNMSEIIDHLDEVIAELFKNIKIDDFKILIGKDNPFGHECGAIVSRYRMNKKKEGLFTLLGPKRMAYDSNLALIKYSHSLISNL